MTQLISDSRSHDSALAGAVRDLCRRAGTHDRYQKSDSHPRWRAVHATGSDLWLDSGDIEANHEVWSAEFSSFTTNNSLLNEEVQKGIYDELLPTAVERIRDTVPSIDDGTLLLELAFVLNAVHGLRLARAFDAHVSVELHTDLARDVDASYEYGRRFHAISPGRFFVKVPLTPEGLLAARRLEKDGVPVNFTLGFSARQNHLIARFARPHFVNVFLGRVNTLFEGAASERPVGEVATIASQRHLRALGNDGLAADHTRQIAASMRGGEQVAALAGVDVLTMPVAAAREFADSDMDPDRIVDRTQVDPTTALRDQDGARDHRPMWDVGGGVVAATEQLLARDPDTLTGDRIRAILADNHAGDLLPDLSGEDRDRIADDGKIPDRRHWQDRVDDGEVGWDALLTEAGLLSFADAQRELDRHVRGLL